MSSSRKAVPDREPFNTGLVRVLFVNVCAEDSLATVESNEKVKFVLLIVESMPSPPIKPRVCESKSIDRLLPSPSVKSRSAAVNSLST